MLNQIDSVFIHKSSRDCGSTVLNCGLGLVFDDCSKCFVPFAPGGRSIDGRVIRAERPDAVLLKSINLEDQSGEPQHFCNAKVWRFDRALVEGNLYHDASGVAIRP